MTHVGCHKSTAAAVLEHSSQVSTAAKSPQQPSQHSSQVTTAAMKLSVNIQHPVEPAASGIETGRLNWQHGLPRVMYGASSSVLSGSLFSLILSYIDQPAADCLLCLGDTIACTPELMP